MIFTSLCYELVQFFYLFRQFIYMVPDDLQFLSLEFIEFELVLCQENGH